MRQAKIYRYALPMDSRVILRDNKLTQRIGFIVELIDDDKIVSGKVEGQKIGRGEIAPLIGFSHENLEQAYQQLQTYVTQWVSQTTLEPIKLPYSKMYPSVAFGLSMALLELDGGLPSVGNYQTALLCTGDPDELMVQLAHTENKRKVAKVKVGLYEPIRDGMLVTLLLESIPDLHLRLDANQAWTFEKTQKFVQYVPESLRPRIDFLEEPCKSVSDSLEFAKQSGIAIAWDETLQAAIRNHPDTQVSDLPQSEAIKCHTIVIKPTLIGSVERCVTLIEQAQQQGIGVVISSSLESSFGLNQLARLAQHYLPEQVPGLDTISLFTQQLETAWPNCNLPVVSLADQDVVWQLNS